MEGFGVIAGAAKVGRRTLPQQFGWIRGTELGELRNCGETGRGKRSRCIRRRISAKSPSGHFIEGCRHSTRRGCSRAAQPLGRGLSQGHLPPLRGRAACVHQPDRRGALTRAAIGERHGEAAVRARAPHARAISWCHAHGRGTPRGGPGDPAAPAHRGLSRRFPRLHLGQRAPGGGAARARRVRRAGGADGGGARSSHGRSAR